MSKLNQIQNAILEMDGVRYQKLIESYLFKKRNFLNIKAIGSVAGRDKAKQGNPDILFPFDDGTYVFAECTTQQGAISSKLEDDLSKDLDETHTGIPVSTIREIIFCFTSNISTANERALKEQCAENGISFTTVTLDTLSQDLFHSFPGLAKEFLGIEVDTRQILSLDDFVVAYGKNKLTAPLDTPFLARNEEIKRVVDALEETSVVVISGKPGLGKSRLALECCANFKMLHPEFITHAIHNTGPDLFEDMRAYFSAPGHHLILIDDANRLSSLEYFVHLLNESSPSKTIKIIATVRDYAIEKVKETFRPIGSYAEIQVQPLEEKVIETMLRENYGIKNQTYLERIKDISKGNPRIAIMAATLAAKANTLESIRDVSALYEVYFSSIKKDLHDLGDPNLLKVAAIVAFFRQIDRTQNELMSSIERAFGINASEFWKHVQKLHEMEIFDMYEDEIVRVSDQVLSTYLFYLSVIQEKKIPLGVFLNEYFPAYKNRLVDVLNGVLGAFDFKQVGIQIKPHVDEAWQRLHEAEDESLFLKFVETFWFLKPTDTLVFIKGRIQALNAEPTQPSPPTLLKSPSDRSEPSILGILGQFSHSGTANTKMALSLLFKYLEKLPNHKDKVFAILTGSYGFTRFSHLQKYQIQKMMIDELGNKTTQDPNRTFSELYLSVANHFLATEFRDFESNGASLTWYQFNLNATPEILALRTELWSKLFGFRELDGFLDLTLKALPMDGSSKYYQTDKSIIAHDATLILPFLLSALDESSYRHCQIFHDYLDVLDAHGVPYDLELNARFKNGAYELSKLLIFDFMDRKRLSLPYTELEAYKASQLKEYCRDFDFDAYQTLITECVSLKSLVKSADHHHISNAISLILLDLSKKDSSLYARVIGHYLTLGNPLELYGYDLVHALISEKGSAFSHGLLWENDAPTPWKFGFYWNLPHEEINAGNCEELLQLYNDAEIGEMPNGLDFLIPFNEFQGDMVFRVAQIILDKQPDSQRGRSPLSLVLNPYSDIAKQARVIFSDRPGLLRSIYFAVCEDEQHADYGGLMFNVLLDIDSGFIEAYLDWLYRKENWANRYDDASHYKLIWGRKNYESVMMTVVSRLLQKKGEDSFYSILYLQTFFFQGDPETTKKQDEFLMNLLRSRSDDQPFIQSIFQIICNLSIERRLPFIEEILRLNKSVEFFSELHIEPASRGWSGSAVPMYQGLIDDLHLVVPLLNDLDLIEHRGIVEARIASLYKQIESEKRRNFLND